MERNFIPINFVYNSTSLSETHLPLNSRETYCGAPLSSAAEKGGEEMNFLV
jgi:hypothetical protein